MKGNVEALRAAYRELGDRLSDPEALAELLLDRTS